MYLGLSLMFLTKPAAERSMAQTSNLFDQFTGIVNHLLVALFPLLLICQCLVLGEVLHGDASNIHGPPHEHT